MIALMGSGVGVYELPFFRFDLLGVNHEAAELVGDGGGLDVVVSDLPCLAPVLLSKGRIELHPIFNVGWLPVEVMRHVLAHEHIHAVVPPREVEPGVIKSHPPEFWDMERKLSPLASVAWTWMYLEWGEVLRSDKETECVWMKRGWRGLRRRRELFWEGLCREAGARVTERSRSWEDALARFRSDPVDGELL